MRSKAIGNGAWKAVMDGFAPKPVRFNELRKAIAKYYAAALYAPEAYTHRAMAETRCDRG
jgi:hypothetical protein